MKLSHLTIAALVTMSLLTLVAIKASAQIVNSCAISGVQVEEWAPRSVAEIAPIACAVGIGYIAWERDANSCVWREVPNQQAACQIQPDPTPTDPPDGGQICEDEQCSGT